MRPRSSLLVLNGLLAGFGLLLLGLASSKERPSAQAQANLAFRAFVPGVGCDNCSLPPSPPTQSSTLVPTPTTTAPVASFEVVFLDVGQGDATLITVNGERLLIDAGRTAGTIQARLQAQGVTDLDAILATHPDADHIGGFAQVLSMYEVERVYLNGGTSESQTFAGFMNAVAAEGAQVTTLSRGQTIPLGGLSLPVLHPSALTNDSNADSLVVRLTCGSVDVLLTGDAEAPSENSMLSAGVLTDIDVLKVGHHGSNSSSTAAFLQATKPEIAVISVGRTNQYGHPHPQVLARLADAGASLLYTDTTAGDDSVVMTSNCQTYQFSTLPIPPSSGTPTASPSGSPTFTATATHTPTPTAPGGTCDPSYPSVCIPSPPPDLDCGEIPYTNFTVIGNDPHNFDGDNDGVGCET